MIEERLTKAILDEFRLHIAEISNFIALKTGHFLLSYMDSWVLRTVLSHLRHIQPKQIIKVGTLKETENLGKDAIVLLYIDRLGESQKQTIIYNLLEDSRKNINLILASRSCMCIESLEKRVRSRFNQRIVFLPYLSTRAICELVGNDEMVSRIVPSCQDIIKYDFSKKYDIKKYSFNELYRILTPVHLALLILCEARSISNINTVEEFRRLTLTTRELRATTDTDILGCYFDLLCSGMVSRKSRILPNFEEIRSFIKKEAPTYIKNLLK